MSSVEQASEICDNEHYRVLCCESCGEPAAVMGAVEVLGDKGFQSSPQSRPLGTVMTLILIAPSLLLYSQSSPDISVKPISLIIFWCGRLSLFLFHGVAVILSWTLGPSQSYFCLQIAVCYLLGEKCCYLLLCHLADVTPRLFLLFIKCYIWLFVFHTLKMSFHCHLAFIVSLEKFTNCIIVAPLQQCLFLLCLLLTYSLWFCFLQFTMIYLDLGQEGGFMDVLQSVVSF